MHERVRKAPRHARPCNCGQHPRLIERSGREVFAVGPATVFYLECCSCRVTGERHPTIRAAVRAWGVRTPPPKPPNVVKLRRAA